MAALKEKEEKRQLEEERGEGRQREITQWREETYLEIPYLEIPLKETIKKETEATTKTMQRNNRPIQGEETPVPP